MVEKVRHSGRATLGARTPPARQFRRSRTTSDIPCAGGDGPFDVERWIFPSLPSRQLPQILKRIQSRPMSIAPRGLQRIPSDEPPPAQFKTRRRIMHLRPLDVPHGIRLAAALRTRTSPPQRLKGKIALLP